MLATLGERLRMPHARREVASRRPHAAERHIAKIEVECSNVTILLLRRIACILGLVVEELAGCMVEREALQASLEALLGGPPRETAT